MGTVPAKASKPFVQVACVCEKALIEPDGVPSLIRVVDTYTVDAAGELPDLPPGFGVLMPLWVVVSLKSGDVVGEHEVALQLHGPNNQPFPARKWRVVFNGGEHGVNVRVAFTLDSPIFGLYWFDVIWENEVLTRIPFRLKPKATTPTADSAVPSESAKT